jgi:hypothetical protein
LGGNDLGPEGGIAIAEALKINKTITTIEWGSSSTSLLLFGCVTPTLKFAFLLPRILLPRVRWQHSDDSYFCYPLVLQLGSELVLQLLEQTRPRGWHRDRRGAQDQHNYHQHQVRLALHFVALYVACVTSNLKFAF